MDAEVKFFTEGLGMKVVRQREVEGERNVFVAYGPESLAVKDGGTLLYPQNFGTAFSKSGWAISPAIVIPTH